MNHQIITILLMFTVGCGPMSAKEKGEAWFDAGSDLDVTEPVEFTSKNYSFPDEKSSTSIGALKTAVFPVDWWTTAYGPDDQYASGSGCPSEVNDSLPYTVEGVVTILPDYYFKTDGCFGDEKYYGSYFIQDSSGGVFVLGDSKVAHFDMGDRIKLTVRGGRSSYDLDMIIAHDVEEVVSHGNPIYYEETDSAFGLNDIARVVRVEGTVTTHPDTFGEFTLQGDNGTNWSVQLDSELNRRGVSFEPGDSLRVTGPVIYSYSLLSVVIMRIGQLEVL